MSIPRSLCPPLDQALCHILTHPAARRIRRTPARRVSDFSARCGPFLVSGNHGITHSLYWDP
jgi:hypothetical protein